MNTTAYREVLLVGSAIIAAIAITYWTHPLPEVSTILSNIGGVLFLASWLSRRWPKLNQWADAAVGAGIALWGVSFWLWLRG